MLLFRGNIDGYKLLTESNGEINKQDNDGRISLMVTFIVNKSKMCKYLLKKQCSNQL